MDYYQNLIESGKMVEGDQMPTEEAIGTMFDVSRITVRKALDGLVQGGYVYKIQGKGSFVTSRKADIQLDHLIGFSEEMRELGMEPSSVLINQTITSPNEIATSMLQLEKDQKVYALTRVRYADDIPMAIEKVFLPFVRFAGMEKYDLENSLYAILKNHYACEANRAVQSIQSGLVNTSDAKLLQIKVGAPILRISRTTYDSNDRPFEYTESTYRGDKYIFRVSLSK